jgi:hypothetical protein
MKYAVVFCIEIHVPVVEIARFSNTYGLTEVPFPDAPAATNSELLVMLMGALVIYCERI